MPNTAWTPGAMGAADILLSGRVRTARDTYAAIISRETHDAEMVELLRELATQKIPETAGEIERFRELRDKSRCLLSEIGGNK